MPQHLRADIPDITLRFLNLTLFTEKKEKNPE